MYERGDAGLAVDLGAAGRCYAMAAKGGHKEAKIKLGVLTKKEGGGKHRAKSS